MGDDMAAQSSKDRPAHVPEENVYTKTHWTIIVALLAVCVTTYFAINAG